MNSAVSLIVFTEEEFTSGLLLLRKGECIYNQAKLLKKEGCRCKSLDVWDLCNFSPNKNKPIDQESQSEIETGYAYLINLVTQILKSINEHDHNLFFFGKEG